MILQLPYVHLVSLPASIAFRGSLPTPFMRVDTHTQLEFNNKLAPKNIQWIRVYLETSSNVNHVLVLMGSHAVVK